MLYSLTARDERDLYDEELTIHVVGSMRSIFALWLALRDLPNYKSIVIVNTEGRWEIDPRKGIPFQPKD